MMEKIADFLVDDSCWSEVDMVFSLMMLYLYSLIRELSFRSSSVIDE